MSSYKVEIDRLFGGQSTSHSQHTVTSMVGLVRIVRGHAQGQGHGLHLSVPRACALYLCLSEAGGALWAGATELCAGHIVE